MGSMRWVGWGGRGGTHQNDWQTNGSTGPGGSSPGVCLRNVLI